MDIRRELDATDEKALLQAQSSFLNAPRPPAATLDLPDVTPTTGILRPILERRPPSEKPEQKWEFRKDSRSTAFPEVMDTKGKQSRFARRIRKSREDLEKNTQEAARHGGAVDAISGIQTDKSDSALHKSRSELPDMAEIERKNERRIQSMDPSEISAAIDELKDSMSADTIAFLRKRGASKLDPERNEIQKAHGKGAGMVKGVSRIQDTTEIQDIAETNWDAEIDSSLAVLKNSNNVNIDALAWTKPADENVPAQQMSDAAMRDVFTKIGPEMTFRYDLDGRKLTNEEIRNLPSSSALHHHGADPHKAGYTLGDLILLVRSSVPRQRILSLSILSRVVEECDVKVLRALAGAGGVHAAGGAVHWKCVTGKTNKALISGWLAFLERFVDRSLSDIGFNELEEHIYFGSPFYSIIQPSRNNLVNALIESEAAESCLRSGLQERSGLALKICLRIIQCSPDATHKLWTSSSSYVMKLWSAICDPDLKRLHFAASAASLMAWIICFVGKPALSLQKLSSSVSHLGWVLDTNQRKSSDMLSENDETARLETIIGVLKLLRAALRMQNGVEAAFSMLSSICQIAQGGQNSFSKEAIVQALLALEALTHAVATSSTDVTAGKEEDSSLPPLATAVVRQLIPLVPSAIQLHCDAQALLISAAAGHLAATVLIATSRSPSLGSTILWRIQDLSRRVFKNLSSVESSTKIVSLSHLHASARLIARADSTYTASTLRAFVTDFFCLIRDSYVSSQDPLLRRALANATAEWLCLYSSYLCVRLDNRKKIERNKGLDIINWAFRLLEEIRDAEIAAAVMAKCLFRLQILTAVDPSLQDASGAKISQKFFMEVLDNVLRSEKEQWAVPTRKEIFWRACLAIGSEEAQRWVEVMRVAGVVPATDILVEYLPNRVDKAVEVAKTMNGDIFPSGKGSRVGPGLDYDGSFANSLLVLCDCLVEEYGSEESPAGDIIASAILRREVDTSLRTALWARTVDLCGNCRMFANAKLLGGRASLSVDEFEDPFVLENYVNAFTSGYLTPERCRGPFRDIVFGRLKTAALNDARLVLRIAGDFSEQSHLEELANGSASFLNLTVDNLTKANYAELSAAERQKVDRILKALRTRATNTFQN